MSLALSSINCDSVFLAELNLNHLIITARIANPKKLRRELNESGKLENRMELV